MRPQKLLKVQIAQAIAIGQEKRIVLRQVACPAEAASGHGVRAGVQHCHAPVVRQRVRPFNRAGLQVDGKIAVPGSIMRSEEQKSEPQSLKRTSYAVSYLNKK